MTDEINKLKAAGFNDADIQAYINDQKNRAGQPAAVDPAQVDATQPIIVDEKVPQYAVQEETIMPSMGQAAAAAAAMLPAVGNAVAAAAPYALGAAGLYGGSKLLSAVSTAAEAYKTGVATDADTASRNVALQEARMTERAARVGRAPTAPVEPVSSSPIPDANGRPIVRPVAPGPVPGSAAAAEARLNNLGSYRPGMDRMPAYTGESPFGELGKFSPGSELPGKAASQSNGFIDRMMQLANKYAPAAKRVTGQVGRALAPLAPVARVLGSAPVMGAQMMLHSGETGPQVPSVGRQRGSEINQLTGRPWSAAELAAYQRNPDAYDRQLAAAQLPR